MAKVTRSTAKGYFNTGDKPTEAQFSDLIDSTPFFDSTDSNAGVDVTSGNATNLRGLVTIARDADAKSGTNTPQVANTVTVVRPAQLPTIESSQINNSLVTEPAGTLVSPSGGKDDANDVNAFTQLANSGLDIEQSGGNTNVTVRVDTTTATSTRNRYSVRLSNTILNWLGNKLAPFINADNPTATGTGVLVRMGADSYRWKNILAGSGISVINNTNDLTIANTQTPGEINTASNLGSGSQVFASKSGVDLRFRSLTVTTNTNVGLTQNTNDIAITGLSEVRGLALHDGSIIGNWNSSTNSGKYQTISNLPVSRTTNQNYSFRIGTRVRLTDPSNTPNWIEGVVTDVFGDPYNTFSLLTDRIGGSYTYFTEVNLVITLADGVASTNFSNVTVSAVTNFTDTTTDTFKIKVNTDGLVSIAGHIELASSVSSTSSTRIATLPTNARPFRVARHFYIAATSGTANRPARLTINTSGTVDLQLLGTASDYNGLDLSLDGINFYID